MRAGQCVGPPEHRLQLCGCTLLLAVSVLASLGFMLVGHNNWADGRAQTFGSPKLRMVGLIVAIFEIGCFLGAIGAAILGEQLGRRRTIGHGCVIMLAGAALQAASCGRVQLIVGCFVSGMGMGFVNSTVPVLQAEFSPKASRGTYVCAQLSTLNLGIFLVYWINYAFASHIGSYAWRIPVILQCFYILAILAILPLIPESPRWLAAHDRPDECLHVLARMRAAPTDDGDVRRMHSSILHTAAAESPLGSGSWRDLLDKDQVQSRRRLLLACAIQTFQQLGGINAVICRRALRTARRTLRRHVSIDLARRLRKHPLSKECGIRPARVRAHVGISADMVLRRFLYPVVSHRPNGPETIVSVHDQRHGLCHGGSSRAHLPSRTQDSRSPARGHGRGGHALCLPRRLHGRIPSHCLGVSVRLPRRL